MFPLRYCLAQQRLEELSHFGFPSAAFIAFLGTIRLSDCPHPVCPPSFWLCGILAVSSAGECWLSHVDALSLYSMIGSPTPQRHPKSRLEVKLLQADIIICDAIVMVIPDEHFIQLSEEHICRHMTVGPYIPPHLLALLLELLPAGFPLCPELTALVRGAVIRKTQKVECCGFSSLLRCVLPGEPAKLD